QQPRAGGGRRRRSVQAGGQGGRLLGVVHVVGPGEVEHAAEVVLPHHLGRGLHPVGLDVLRVRGVGRLAVHAGGEELADLLLERHPRDGRGDPAVHRSPGRGLRAGRGGGERLGREAGGRAERAIESTTAHGVSRHTARRRGGTGDIWPARRYAGTYLPAFGRSTKTRKCHGRFINDLRYPYSA